VSDERDQKVIAEWPLNRRERVRVSIDKYKGVDLISLRKWYLDDEDDTLRPGKGGIALNVRHLPSLADAIATALADATARGLVRGTPPNDGSSE